ncbi:DUF2062 domain-containing protein [Brumicola pallidula]|jgi:hypothetical protein|uniref:DUF2062 domain-containing protein n=1 Tax=Brumicola pallidula DSM 14239 = ACAM 615 TaxID=1121922 RepID=K6ZD13_9ALTE|nr:DUF2062 domain-containing protein [Glaciecola pallidula]GAC28242.1 hypothetical protein GPAL_1369 [Glaciecola pallidula DSM 14239 = ACAM 615]
MPKKFIRRYLPSHITIRESKYLRIFGTLLHDPNLWHLNRRSASGAFGIGLFFAFWPIPFQMVFSTAAAIIFRVNLPLSIATVWLTNPLTMPPIFYGAYLVGSTVLGTEVDHFAFELSWSWLLESLTTIGPAFILGCGICSVFFGLLGYFSLDWIWKMSVMRAWKARRPRKK